MLAILTGVIGGLIEPLMIATIVFVYGLIFPSADAASSLLSEKSFQDAPALVTKLSAQSDAVSQFLWGQFNENDRQMLTSAVTASNQPPAILIARLNHLLQCDCLYDSQRFAGSAAPGLSIWPPALRRWTHKTAATALPPICGSTA